MPLEVWNTIATCGTFIVIAATAIAAVVQLRHARGSNRIAALTELRTSFQTAEFSAASDFVMREVAGLVKDPEFRYQVVHRGQRTAEYAEAHRCISFVGNYFEDMGALILAGLLDKSSVNMIYSGDIVLAWQSLLPITALARRTRPATWENFEYVAMLAQKWIAEHPHGDYPHNAPRLEIPDPYREEDAQYVQNRVLRRHHSTPAGV